MQLLVEGKISNQTFEEWNRETGKKKLPERVSRKPSARKKGIAVGTYLLQLDAHAMNKQAEASDVLR